MTESATPVGDAGEGQSSQPGGAEGRRERVRRETFRELDQAAMAEIREHGSVALSLRRVARRMGMSPAGLYRYVDSREALLTRLIAASYHDLADHLVAAVADAASDPDAVVAGPDAVVAGSHADVAERLRSVALAYREWAVEHPQEFGLVFGDPIPGYEAPPGGVTVAAMERVGIALGGPLVDAWAQGRLRPLSGIPLDASLRERLAPMAKIGGADIPAEIPAEVAFTLLATWGRLHGQVSLEVFGHHAWLFPDGAADLYRAEVERVLVDLGVL